MTVTEDPPGSSVSAFGRVTRSIVVVLVVFAGTRLVTTWLADSPGRYKATDGINVVGDVGLYESWSRRIHDGLAAYRGFRVEYPPGVLPFVAAPDFARAPGETYRQRFVRLMLLVDVAGLAALLSIGRRRADLRGAWVWTLGLPLLGPIAYTRLDLVPAVATLWGVERLHAGRASAAGGWFGFGAAAKIYPALLAVPPLVVGRLRRDFARGFALVALLVMLPVLLLVDDVWRQIVDYQTDRGLQIESLAGSIVLVADHLGGTARTVFEASATSVAGTGDGLLRALTTLSTAAVVVGSGLLMSRVRRRDASPELVVQVMLGELLLLMVVGRVFSPQYMTWALALTAGTVACRRRPPWAVVVLVALATALTQYIFPFGYPRLLDLELVPALAVLTRNLLVVAAGVGAWLPLVRLVRAPAGREIAAARLGD